MTKLIVAFLKSAKVPKNQSVNAVRVNSGCFPEVVKRHLNTLWGQSDEFLMLNLAIYKLINKFLKVK